jgi:serine/threonine protein kinase
LETFHSTEHVHRDIKPGNFVIGKGDRARDIYIIDYGLAKRYIDERTREHIECGNNLPLVGTVRYASINTHMGYDQGRRDDLEGLAYSLIFLVKGILPWQGIIRESKKDKNEAIMNKKMECTVEETCEGLPVEFTHFLRYCRELKFEQKPNYKLLTNLLAECFKRNGFKMDFQYDWQKITYDPNSFLSRPVNSNDSNMAELVSKDEGWARDKSPDFALLSRKPPSVAQLQFRLGALKQLISGSSVVLSSGSPLSKQKIAESGAKKGEEEKKTNTSSAHTTLRSRSQDVSNVIPFQPPAKEDDLCNFKYQEMLEDPSIYGI